MTGDAGMTVYFLSRHEMRRVDAQNPSLASDTMHFAVPGRATCVTQDDIKSNGADKWDALELACLP